MQNLNAEAKTAPGVFSAPVLKENSAPFEASGHEVAGAFLTYVAVYVFFRLCQGGPLVDPPERTLGLVMGWLGLFWMALVALVNRGRPRAWESWVWLGCYGLALSGLVLWRVQVWDEGQHVLFLFIFGMWWAASWGGALLEGGSGRLLPMDALNAFILIPFGHFFLRARAAWFGLSRLWRGRERPNAKAIAWTMGAALLAGGLFAAAGALLGAADEGFSALLGRIGAFFDGRLSAKPLEALALSLPVGAYLYGAAAGAGRMDRRRLRNEAEGVDGLWARLRQVPPLAWTALIGAFALMYALFFAVQGRYLFGAFTRTLPEGFIVSEYARRGFFELCGVMAVNFAVLWLALRMSAAPVRAHRGLRAACLALVGESALLAVVALSKLFLYIDCFGFTPLRLQSSWLACTLLAGCVCAAVSIATGRRTARVWMIFGAATLSALCLY